MGTALNPNPGPRFIPLNGQPVNENLLRTYVAIVLDKSGSMQTILDATINGFNNQVDSIVKEAVGQVYLSLVTFNTYVEPVFWNQHPSYLTKLNRDNYKPQGWTALYDAIGYTINRLDYTADDVGNSAFLVIIVSDGAENRSQQFRWTLPDLIKQKQATGRWTFVYVGSGHDIAQATQKLWIPQSNSYTFTNDWASTNQAWETTSGGVSSYFAGRSRGLTASNSFYNPTGGGVTGSGAFGGGPSDVTLTTSTTVAPAPKENLVIVNNNGETTP